MLLNLAITEETKLNLNLQKGHQNGHCGTDHIKAAHQREILHCMT